MRILSYNDYKSCDRQLRTASPTTAGSVNDAPKPRASKSAGNLLTRKALNRGILIEDHDDGDDNNRSTGNKRNEGGEEDNASGRRLPRVIRVAASLTANSDHSRVPFSTKLRAIST